MRNLFQLLEKAAKENPNKIAIKTEDSRYTYNEYYMSTLFLDTYLSTHFSDMKEPVLVRVSDSEYDLFAFMVILAAGLFYIPVNKKISDEKLESIQEKTGARLVLDAKKVKNILANMRETRKELKPNSYRSKKMRESKNGTAFAIMTSGTTGEPKLCAKSHKSILKMCETFDMTFAFSENDVFANQISFDFDGSIKSIYLSLYKQATILLLKSEHFATPKRLLELIEENHANILIWSVFALKILSQFAAFSYRAPKCIEKVMFSGEKIFETTLRYWQENINASYINLYAPTEYSFNVSYHIIKDDENYDNIPIGQTFENSQILILDQDFNETKHGEIGEIFISGAGLSSGYLGDDELTREKFLYINSSVFYRTGDYGFRGLDGLFYICGRKDNQIKHHGYRIELEEIDAQINSILGVVEGVAIYDKKREIIVAAVKSQLDETQIKSALIGRLPKYKQPKIIKKVNDFPRTLNGKIDRNSILD